MRCCFLLEYLSYPSITCIFSSAKVLLSIISPDRLFLSYCYCYCYFLESSSLHPPPIPLSKKLSLLCYHTLSASSSSRNSASFFRPILLHSLSSFFTRASFLYSLIPKSCFLSHSLTPSPLPLPPQLTPSFPTYPPLLTRFHFLHLRT